MNGRAVRYFIGHILRWEAILMLPGLIISLMDRTWDAANGFLIKQADAILLKDLEEFLEVLKRRALEFKETPCICRPGRGS